MGLLSFLRRGDERPIPEPGPPELEALVAGTAIPDSQSVAMGESGWASVSPRIDLSGTGARERVEAILEALGMPGPNRPPGS